MAEPPPGYRAADNACPHPDCGKPIADKSFCCLTHWKSLGRVGRLRVQRERRDDERLRIAGDHWFPEAS